MTYIHNFVLSLFFFEFFVTQSKIKDQKRPAYSFKKKGKIIEINLLYIRGMIVFPSSRVFEQGITQGASKLCP